jgi:hypothetical protein
MVTANHKDLELKQMILRLSQKMTTKFKAGRLTELPLDANPFADWSCHLFNAGRTQYIILMNTASFYSCLMPGKSVTSEASFLLLAKETLGGFVADDGKQFVFSKYIAPTFSDVQMAKPLNRSATGSMNEHIYGAKTLLADGMALNEIGYHLNITPMSALIGTDGKKYASPKEVFAILVDRMGEM